MARVVAEKLRNRILQWDKLIVYWHSIAKTVMMKYLVALLVTKALK